MRRSLFAATVLVAAFTVSAEGCPPPGMRAIPSPMYGVTFDNDSFAGASKLTAQRTALDNLETPHLPSLRIVFDEGVAPEDYQAAIDSHQPHAYILGELLDSSALADISVANYVARTNDYLDVHGDAVDVWEVGNEIGGAWAGSNSSQAAKIAGAYDAVKARGKRAALTLWYNIGCEAGAELNPLEFTDQHVPDRMKTGLDYVFLSYYEVPCNNFRPAQATWRAFFTQLHARYPNSLLGFGEIGLEQATTSATLAKATSIANYYYPLPLYDLPYYVGGHYWWYAAQDVVPWPDLMGETIRAAMQ